MASQFSKNQLVIAVDGRYDARVERRHRDGTITIRQYFSLENGERVGGFLGYRHRIDPALVKPAQA